MPSLMDRFICQQCGVDLDKAKEIWHRQDIARNYKDGATSDELGIRDSDIVEETDTYKVIDKSFRKRDCIRYENPRENSVLFVDRYTHEAQALVFRHE